MKILYESEKSKYYIALSDHSYVVGKISLDKDNEKIYTATNYFHYMHTAALFLANILSGKEAKALASMGTELRVIWANMRKDFSSIFKEDSPIKPIKNQAFDWASIPEGYEPVDVTKM